MAATLPVESEVSPQETTKRSSRRQWSVHAGGPKGLLRRMRSQLAEDGCPESQLVMGRTLLEQLGQEGGEESVSEEEARLAVFWLTRASHQGSAEATDLLQHCLHNNIGICEHNYHEVRDCLAMELQEKLARRAGRLLFASISDGNEVVSSSSLVKKVEQVLMGDAQGCQDPHEQEMKADGLHTTSTTTTTTSSSLEELYGGERFTEEHIVLAAVLYHQGCIPPLHHLLSLPLTLSHTHTPPNTLLRVMRWPLTLLSDLYGACLQFLAVTLLQQGRKCAVASSPFVFGLLFAMFYVFGVRVFEFRRALPVVASCGSFVAMFTSSAAILLNGRKLECLRVWSSVFSHFCPELDVVKAEGRFKGRCWRPYAVLCVSVFVYVSFTPFIPHTLMVAFLPAMCVSASLMYFFAVDRVALWHFISVALYLLALSPEVHGVVNVALQGVGVAGWLVGGEAVKVWGGVSIHLGVGTLLHLLWLGLQVCVGVVKGPSHLPPHLASLVWSHLALVASGKVTVLQDLLYPVAVWLALSLVPAAASFSVLIVPVVVCVGLRKLSATQDIVMLMFVFSACVTFLVQRVWPRVAGGVLRLVVLCAVILTLLRPSAVFAPPASPSQHSPLQWDVYKNVCVSSKDLEAGNVHGCAPLLGTAVRWRGSVLQVTVTEVRNLPQKIVSLLPRFLEAPVKCFLGGGMPECRPGPAGDGTVQEERCQAIRTALGHSTCSLHEWNEYEFDVKLGMQASYWKFGGEADVSLRADDIFRDFMLGLRAGDVVEFTGTMTKGVGTGHLSLSLSAIKCVTCKLKATSVEALPTLVTALPHPHSLWEAVRYTFNFFLAPTLTV